MNKKSNNLLLLILKVKGIVLFSILCIFLSLFSVIIPFFSGQFINSILLDENRFVTFLFLSCSVFFIVFLKLIQRKYVAKLTKIKQIELQRYFLEKISSISIYRLEKYPVGELGLKFFRDIPNATSFLHSFYPQIIEIVCGSIFAFVFAIYSNYIVAIVFFVGFLISLGLFPSCFRKFNKINSLIRRKNDTIFSKIFERFNLLAYLKSMNSEMYYIDDSYKTLKNTAKLSYKNNIFDAHFDFLVSIQLACGEIIVVGVSAYLTIREIITIGDVIFFQMLFISTFNSFANLYRMIPSWSYIKESLNSLNEINSDLTDIHSNNIIDFAGKIKIDNLYFSYNNSERHIIEKFSGKFVPGEIVQIKGGNGSGKTTLLKILSACYLSYSGYVFYDDILGNNINAKCIRDKVSVVTQETIIITDSIRNNITLHNKNYSEQEILDVVSLVGLTSLIDNFKDGISQKVGNNGIKLSGGEIQKIGIARALIRKPKILVLDEVTNHLDSESQKIIYDLIEKLRGNTTVFFVSHNENVTINFDKIIEL